MDPPLNGGELQRAEQALAVNGFVADFLADDRRANVVVAGDLNEFEFEEPLAALEFGNIGGRGRRELFNLTDELPRDERYSYVFEGNSQSLDHILVSRSLRRDAEFDAVHVNSEFAESPGRASDHDPLLALLEVRPGRIGWSRSAAASGGPRAAPQPASGCGAGRELAETAHRGQEGAVSAGRSGRCRSSSTIAAAARGGSSRPARCCCARASARAGCSSWPRARLEVFRGEVEIARVDEPGAVFGEMSVLLDIPHTTSVRAADGRHGPRRRRPGRATSRANPDARPADRDAAGPPPAERHRLPGRPEAAVPATAGTTSAWSTRCWKSLAHEQGKSFIPAEDLPVGR